MTTSQTPGSDPSPDPIAVDTVIFDIDGVLVDVGNSYRRAIVETVERIYGHTIPRESIQAFKNATGFNNDWELTDAVTLYVLARKHAYSKDVEAFTSAIRNAGGGLDAALTVLERDCEEYEAVTASWRPDEIRDVFQQLYLGRDLYGELEGTPPTIESEGFINDEPVLIDPETIANLAERFHLGVLTGRPAAEADLALERVGLSIPPEFRQTMDDETPGKPAPDGLLLLAERFDASAVAFVGDTIDDIIAAVTADSSDPDRSYHGIGVLTGGLTGVDGTQTYIETGATAVIETVNDLPTILTDPARCHENEP